MAGSAAVTTGQVNFCDESAKTCTDVHLLATEQLTGAGTATFKFRPGMGNHSYKAVFAGTKTFAASSSSAASLSASGPIDSSTTTIAQSGAVGNYNLTATVTGSGLSAPTGDVSFMDTTNANAMLWTETLVAGQATATWVNTQSPATVAESESIVVGDFNEDGIPDLVAGGSTTQPNMPAATLMVGNGDGTFTTSALLPATIGYVNSIVVGDFNGDGHADLAIAGYESTYVLLGNGDGTFTVCFTYDGFLESVAAGDFNGDGIQDLVLVSDSVQILIGKGDGTFTALAPIPISSLISSPHAVEVGDFNGDGHADLAITNQIDSTVTYAGSSVSILLGKGDGTFTSAPTIYNPPVQPRAVVIGDFNSDGIEDLAVAGYGSQVFLGNGDGTFQDGIKIADATMPRGDTRSSITMGDFNGDGKADLAVVSPDDYSISDYFGNGDGTFTQGPSSPTGVFPWAIAAGDFSGDGASDLAVSNVGASTVTILTAQVTQTAVATATEVSIQGHGVHQVDASYPGDSNYAGSLSGTTGLTAVQALPSINWPTPMPVAYGTALSEAQLDATASVPGNFVYRPAAGAIPPIGDDTLSVTFTPADNVDYASATATVTLSVYPVPILLGMTPAISDAGGAALSITVNGSGFLEKSTAYWGTTALTTKFVNSTQLTATVPAADVAQQGATAISVKSAGPGSATSNSMQFEVDSASAAATAPGISNAAVTVKAGSGATYAVTFPASVASATAACLNLPAGAKCSYSNTTRVLTIATASTTPTASYQVTAVFTEVVSSGTTSSGVLLPLFLPMLMIRRRKRGLRRKGAALWLSLLVLSAVAFSVGCSNVGTHSSTQSVTSSRVIGLTVE